MRAKLREYDCIMRCVMAMMGAQASVGMQRENLKSEVTMEQKNELENSDRKE